MKLVRNYVKKPYWSITFYRIELSIIETKLCLKMCEFLVN